MGSEMCIRDRGGVLDTLGLWVMYLATVVTVVTGIDYLRQAFGPVPDPART